MSLLEVDSVLFSYGNTRILSNVYLKIARGEVVGFLGRNGCGKSTLLKIIFGTLKGTSQSVRINGKYESLPFRTEQLKYLPQGSLFPGFLTPEKAAILYDAAQEALLKEPEVSAYWKMPFEKMSGGIAKFVETLIVLHSPGQFVLLDEPFSFIAPVLVERLIPIIRQAALGKGILLTDHQYESIFKVSDRLHLLKNQCLYPIHGKQDLLDRGYIR